MLVKIFLLLFSLLAYAGDKPRTCEKPAAQALLGGRRAQQFADLASFVVDGELSALLEREHVWLLAPHLPKS